MAFFAAALESVWEEQKITLSHAVYVAGLPEPVPGMPWHPQILANQLINYQLSTLNQGRRLCPSNYFWHSGFSDFPTALCRINGLDAVFSVSQLHHAKCCDAWHRHYVACLSTQRSQTIKVKLKPNMTRLLFFSAKNRTFFANFWPITGAPITGSPPLYGT